jgi:NADH dehydrogenase (ubiquinone) Fe-S protein 6
VHVLPSSSLLCVYDSLPLLLAAPLQVEYINLRGTSKENPAVCKYTGNKFYSEPHTWLAH